MSELGFRMFPLWQHQQHAFFKVSTATLFINGTCSWLGNMYLSHCSLFTCWEFHQPFFIVSCLYIPLGHWTVHYFKLNNTVVLCSFVVVFKVNSFILLKLNSCSLWSRCPLWSTISIIPLGFFFSRHFMRWGADFVFCCVMNLAVISFWLFSVL